MNLPEGVLAELIDGEILLSPSPRPYHQELALNPAAPLRDFAKRRQLGKVFSAPLDVHLPPATLLSRMYSSSQRKTFRSFRIGYAEFRIFE